MSHVFVVQRQHKLVQATNELVPKFDLTPAEKYGELIFLLSPTARPYNPQPVIDDLRRSLAGYTSDDYLLLIGNPVLIGLAMSVAARSGDGRVKLLQWSGKKQEYIPIEVDLG
jgi:hypothetical protein